MKIKKLKWIKHSGKLTKLPWTEYICGLATFGRIVVTNWVFGEDPGWTVTHIHEGGCTRLPGKFKTATKAKQAAEAHWHAKLMEVLEP